MAAALSSVRAGGLFLQPPRPSAQHAAAALPVRSRLALRPVVPAVRAQTARQEAAPEEREGPAAPQRRTRGAGAGRAGGRKAGGTPRGPVRQAGGKAGEPDQRQRLNKAIASAGVASRRAADDLVFEGRVKVNGVVVREPGRQVDLRRDKVVVNGRELSGVAAQRKYYFALNKPKGYVCSNAASGRGEGEEDARLVISLFDEWLERWRARQARGAGGGGAGAGAAGLPPRLFTVGRLDVASVGLIFVTNDGDWAHKVMHPSSGITKEYSLTLTRKPRPAELEAVAAGCEMGSPPVHVRPVAVARDDTDASKPNRIRVVVAEGRNREVRNLVEHAGLEVKTLRRVRVGGYRLPRDLAFGRFVELRPWEVRRVLNVGADRMA